MSTSSDSVEIKDSDSEPEQSSPVQLSQPPSASTRSKGRLPPPTPPQPPSASTRSKARLPLPTPPSARTHKKDWMVNSTKTNLSSSHGSIQASNPVINVPTASPNVGEVIESATESTLTHSPTDTNHTKARHASVMSNQPPARSVRREMFNEVLGHASTCRTNLKDMYQKFLRFMDVNASHHGHLIEPATLEFKLTEFVGRLSIHHLGNFLQTSVMRTFWEVVKDLQDTELLVFQTLGRINNLSNASPVHDKSNTDIIMDHFATIITTSDSFCTRMSARLTLTPEQSIIFGENDIMDAQAMCFRLVASEHLPSVEDRLRLLWAVSAVYPMRTRFLNWNNTLSGRITALKDKLEALSAAIEDAESEARGTKRKAQEEIQTDQ